MAAKKKTAAKTQKKGPKMAKKEVTKRTVNKSALVRACADTMSAAAVVAAMKAEYGLDITPAYVHSIRTAARAKGSKGEAAEVAPATEAAAPAKRKPGRPRKTSTDAVAEVLKANVSEARVGSNGHTSGNGHASLPAGTSTTITHRAEALLKSIAAEIGFARAIEFLRNEQSKVHSLLGLDSISAAD